MRNPVKQPLIFWASILFVFALGFKPRVQAAPVGLSAQLSAVEATAPTPAGAVPASGQFYPASLANRGIFAPIFPPGIGLPAWNLGDGVWLVNDLEPVTPLRNGMRMMALDGGPMPPGTGGGSGATNTYMFNSVPLDTNRLWLELTNVSSGVGYANLHRATNQVYAIWGTTNLAIPFADWQVEAEVWPTNNATMPFTLATQDQQTLFLKAEDWTGVTENGNTVPDWWLWNYFKTTALSDTNLDNTGRSLLVDYEYGFDPNLIQFSLRFASADVDASPAAGTIDLLGGEPAYMAVLVNDTNQAHAVWQSYNPNVSANLTAGDGAYTVMVGLRGLAPDATPSWLETTLTLNTAPLVITVTNPALTTVAQPLIQLQGFASQPLASLDYDLSNAAGIFSNQPGFVTGQAYDTNLIASAAYFQCYDLALTNGVNLITLHATDIFGHTATTNVSLTLDYGRASNPVISLLWPTNNAVVAGTNFTLQGWLDDATASVVVSVGTNHFPALVERDGRFSAAHLPLSGTNTFTIAATNAAGLGASRTLTVLQSAVLVTVDPSPASGQEFTTVTGTVSDGSHDVYVNGVKAIVGGDLTWSVTNVPVLNSEGSGQLAVNAYPAGSDTNATPPAASLQTLNTMQPLVQAVSYRENFVAHDHLYLLIGTDSYDIQIIRQWANGKGGTTVETSVEGWSQGSTTKTINLFWPVYWPDGGVLSGNIAFSTVTYTSPYSAYAPATWVNGTMAISGGVRAGWQDGYLAAPAHRQLTRQASTDVQLVAGGPALPGAYQLIRLLVSAAAYSDNGLAHEVAYYDTYPYTGFEAPGDVPLPASAIQVLDQPVTPTATNAYVGELYVALPAGATKNLPVRVTGTGSSNYSFNVQPETGLMIVDGNTGMDLTDQTNTVIVGQPMNLILKTITTNGPALSNFHWSVPGFAISNYVASGSSGIVYTNFPINQSSVAFYWVDGASNRTVTCTATVQGKTVTAQAIFNVLKPAAIVTTLTGAVALDDNFHIFSTGIDLFGLHYGDTNSRGISFFATVSVPAGFSGSNQWVQIINFENRGHQFTNGVWYVKSVTNVLDTFYPYAPNISQTSDSPGEGVDPTDEGISASDSFSMWLMFKPNDGQWVPLKKVDWNWGGAGTLSGTN
jgi:hypothetical protein